MKHLSGSIINLVINVFCIAIMLCSTSWAKLWWDHKLARLSGLQTMVDGHRRESNQCSVDDINRWSIFYSHVSYAIDVHPVNMINNFSVCKLELELLL